MKNKYNVEKDEKRKVAIAAVAALMVVLAALLGPLIRDDSSSLNSKYPLLSPPRGIDVSEYQKEIDWNKVRRAGYSFAFIKATEGKDYKDAFFRENWKKAGKAGLTRGAYHFFLFRRTGLEQAENFIGSVPVEDSSMPPVIDVEMGGSNGNDPDVEAVRAEMGVFIEELKKRYGRTPIIYTNLVTYNRLVASYFPECPIWIAAPDSAPALPDGRPWTVWQYTFTGSVDGITGRVDLNVYNNGEARLEELVLTEQAAQ